MTAGATSYAGLDAAVSEYSERTDAVRQSLYYCDITFLDLLTFPWVSFALVGADRGRPGERGHADEGFGAVVAVGPFRQCPDVDV